jgi:hypothetical protein
LYVKASFFADMVWFLATIFLLQAIKEFISLNQNIGELKLQEGEWQMVWSSQVIR